MWIQPTSNRSRRADVVYDDWAPPPFIPIYSEDKPHTPMWSYPAIRERIDAVLDWCPRCPWASSP
jgi:hypothetical protein